MASTHVASVESLLERFIEPLFAGDRSGARALVAEAFEEGLSAEEILMQMIWPTMEKVQGMYRADRINTGMHHMASRLLRMLADQLALRLPRAERNGRTMLVVCSPGEPEELGAQITTDIAEAHGWTVHFAGGGVPNDEIVGWIGQLQPQVLMVYGTIPSGGADGAAVDRPAARCGDLRRSCRSSARAGCSTGRKGWRRRSVRTCLPRTRLRRWRCWSRIRTGGRRRSSRRWAGSGG